VNEFIDFIEGIIIRSIGQSEVMELHRRCQVDRWHIANFRLSWITICTNHVKPDVVSHSHCRTLYYWFSMTLARCRCIHVYGL